MATNLELYERLKQHLDEETARMLVETLPRGEELVTKGDLDVALKGLETRLLRRMLTFQVSIWVGFAATIVTVVLGG